MSFPHDRTSLGDLIAQHYDPKGTWGGSQESRRRQGRCRFLGFDKTTGEPVFDRIGWHHGDVAWLATGQGKNLLIPVWQQSFPALILPAAVGTTTGPKYDTKVVGPLAQPAYKQFGGTWQLDEGLQPQPGALPLGLQLPAGFPVNALGMSILDEQQLALIPSGGILIAVKNGGIRNGGFGTPVFDVTAGGAIDITRFARDHSHWCVYLLPLTSPVGFYFAGNGAVKGASPPGGLAWELGPSVDQQGGHGVVTDIPSKAGTPAQPIQEVFTGPGGTLEQGYVPLAKLQAAGLGPKNAQPVIVDGVQIGYTTGTQEKPPESKSEPPKTQEKPNNGDGGKTVAGAPAVLAVASYRGRGPHNVGETDDVHQLAVTPDGKPVNSLHTDEGEIIIGDTGDAPRKHDKGAWVAPRPDGPFTNEVYHRNDPTDEHVWMGKRVSGLRKWQGTDYMDVPQPNGERPGQPINPPPPPPPPPGPKPKPKPGPKPGPDPGPKPDPLPPDKGGGGEIGKGAVDVGSGLTGGPVPSTPGDEGIYPPPGGYFDGNGRPLYPGFGGPLSPFAPDGVQPANPNGGNAGANPAGGVVGGQLGPTPPVNPGGAQDGPVQRQYPAMGTALGFYEMIARMASIATGARDPRYQFDTYTAEERKQYDNGPAGLRINGFVETSGGKPVLDGPQCSGPDVATGTSPRGGISIGTSDFDLITKLRNERIGKTTKRPVNEGLVTHEERVDQAFGDTNQAGLPANGWRHGRFYDPETGDKFMSIDETDEDGHLVSEIPAVLVDFIAQVMYLWGQPVFTGTPSGAVNRRLSSNLTLADGYCLIASSYFDLNGYTLTLEGDAVLEVT